jgi:cysteine desulfurase
MIYLDHHATTPVDPAVVEAMLPWLTTHFGNPHSVSHAMGRHAATACQHAIESLATRLGTSAELVLVTSGATESNNLAIDGVLRHPRQRRRHIIAFASEHPAVLDPVARLEREGYRVTVLPVLSQDHADCGQVDLELFEQSLCDDTALVSVMWANNEIGVIQPMKRIAELVHKAGALLHCDATQAVGRLPVSLEDTGIDLLSASAHKFYGPKGVGLLAIGKHRRVRLRPLFEGGGQQHGLRSGTLNVAGLIGMAEALAVCEASRDADNLRQAMLRDRLWDRLQRAFAGAELNGPDWKRHCSTDQDVVSPATDRTKVESCSESACRLPNNLNVAFVSVEGETLMAASPELAVSSGSACSSVDPRPSHVLTAIGLSESRARRSIRFGLGRFTTAEEIDAAVEMLVAAHEKLGSV